MNTLAYCTSHVLDIHLLIFAMMRSLEILTWLCTSHICFLKVIAEYLQKVDPKSDGAKRDWVAIYDECASVLYQVSFGICR